MIEILQYPNPKLITECTEASNYKRNLAAVKDLMYMIENHRTGRDCIGLAANQIGVTDARVLVLDTRRLDLEIPGIFINPVILETFGSAQPMLESCMSFPNDIEVVVPRYNKIRVAYFDTASFRHENLLSGLTAQAFQHELDHLDGITLYENGSKEDKLKIINSIDDSVRLNSLALNAMSPKPRKPRPEALTVR